MKRDKSHLFTHEVIIIIIPHGVVVRVKREIIDGGTQIKFAGSFYFCSLLSNFFFQDQMIYLITLPCFTL